MDAQLWPALVTAVVAPALTLLLQRALSWRNDRAKAGADEAVAEASVAEQWQAWSAHQGQRIAALEARVSTLETALADERAENGNLRAQVEVQSRLLRSVCRWALLLRDELLKAGGVVPATPVDVEAALTSLDS
jgi:hypothetical protein